MKGSLAFFSLSCASAGAAVGLYVVSPPLGVGLDSLSALLIVVLVIEAAFPPHS